MGAIGPTTGAVGLVGAATGAGPPAMGSVTAHAIRFVVVHPARLPITIHFAPGIPRYPLPLPEPRALPLVALMAFFVLLLPASGCCSTTVFGGAIGGCASDPKFSSSP